MEIWFEVQGSQPEPYRVLVRRAGSRVLLDCTCQAGQIGGFCKHRVTIMDGIGEGVISSSHTLAEVMSMLPGTPVLDALIRLRSLEQQADALKKEIAKAKKALGREMTG